MQVIFAGGASGVGASCVAIELAGQWFVVDAGVRVGRQEDPLPDLSLLEDKDVRAIFVTHAHADHIGALPLLHQAFPSAPIFASRATGLLMEVMLADALKIMNRRAVEEMELPLYPPELVARMLDHVRPLPVGETLTLPALPGVTISTSRAGHIAGAISFGFAASDGSLVISGDISSTPQRTILGAVPPALERPDLLVLESTYGSRLHPNRQAEEQRFALAVAEGIARGGHTLIPCFGLGRGQELLLILQAAQEQGQIPPFPIYVDGLVRRVCSTYLLMPEALTPRLQRQIRKGFLPFSGPQINFVRDERDRERILAGPPACILSSSGMLTGGPSAWYAARLAGNPQSSILITGYQDEESPGKRLLDLADQQTRTLELDGNAIQVNCHVAKYSLSAHADGSELAAYAAALKPRRVALVHGDEDARHALQEKLTGFEVLLPSNGKGLNALDGHSPRRLRQTVEQPLPMLPTAIGHDQPFSFEAIPHLWEEVRQLPGLRVVTARELAVVWYGEATEAHTQHMLDILTEDYDQRYFVRQHALEEAFRVRGQQEETSDDFLNDLIGSILLMQLRFEHSKPALCLEIEPPAFIRAILPQGVAERTRFPYSAILEVIGPMPEEAMQARTASAAFLAQLVKTAHTQRRHISLHALAQQCQEGATYTLSELCEFAGVDPQDLVSRLAVAKLLHLNPLLFTQQSSVLEGDGLALYTLAPEWQEALQEPEKHLARPDQHNILTILEQHIGSPPDLARRSVDPDTGAVTLHFHFPLVAFARYQEAIEAASEEAGVPITISSSTNQNVLSQVARELIPSGLTSQSGPSLYIENNTVQYTCTGRTSPEEIAAAQERFRERTGWHLELKGSITLTSQQPDAQQETEDTAQSTVPPVLMPQHQAMQVAQERLSQLPGFYRVGLDLSTISFIVRFHFPEAAQRHYAAEIKSLEAETGWHVRLYPTAHQEALVAAARRLLPSGLTSTEPPSLFHNEHKLRLHCQGTATQEEITVARQTFLEETGWRLELALSSKKDQPSTLVSQSEAIAQAWVLFSGVSDLYRVEADNKRKILWLYFHFPDIAQQRYAAQCAALTAQTGWRPLLHPYTHQKALIELAYRLLLPEVPHLGKTTVYPERKQLVIAAEDGQDGHNHEALKQRFQQQTGWTLELSPSVGDTPV